MSTDTAVQEVETETPAIDPSASGGSPADVETSEETETTEEQPREEPAEQPAEGAEPEAGRQTGESPDTAEVARLRDLARQQDEILRDIQAQMDRDPELARKLSRSSDSGSRAADVYNHFKTTISDGTSGLTPDSAAVMERAMQPVFDLLRSQETALGRLDPAVAQLNRTVGGDQFEKALAANGIPPEVRNSPQFKKHLGALQTDRDFASDLRNRQAYAGRVAAKEWLARNGKVQANRDERTRLDSVRRQSSGNAPTRSSSIAERVVRITRAANGAHIDEAARIRFEAEKANKPLPRIEYVDRK